MDEKDILKIISKEEVILEDMEFSTEEDEIVLDEFLEDDIEISDMLKDEEELFEDITSDDEVVFGDMEFPMQSPITSYNVLRDKPSINNVELIGNKTLKQLGIPDEEIQSIPNSELEMLLR